MFKSYIKVAIRTINRNRGYSAISVFGLAVGMACCILISMWVRDELSYDGHHQNADRICRVLTGDWTTTPAPLAETLIDEYPEIVDAARFVLKKWKLSYDDKSFAEQGALVDPSFLEIFTFTPVSGDLSTAFTEPNSIVLTERTARKLFGDEDPLGKQITGMSQFDLTVTAVIENTPRTSHFNFDWLAPEHFLHFMWGPSDFTWSSGNFKTYVLLRENESPETVSGKISDVVAAHNPGSTNVLRLQSLKDIHLYGIRGGSMTYVYIFSATAVFLLLIACMNFMNLATARSAARAKEVGIRKVTGARRIDLIRQFLGESLLYAFLALLLAVILVELFLPAFNDISGKEVTLNYIKDWKLCLILVGITLFTGVVAGSYPALVLSSFSPTTIMRRSVSGGRSAMTLRRILVISQFAVSIILIVGAVVVQNQLDYIRNMDLGYDEEHVLCLDLRKDLAANYNTIAERLSQHPSISGIALTSSLPDQSESSADDWDWEGRTGDGKLVMSIMSITYGFPQVFGTEMAEGRFFSPEYSTDIEDGVIVNEAAVKAMQMDSPIGKRFASNGISHIRGQIIGVVKDFHFRSIHHEIGPLVLRIIPRWLDNVSIKIAATDIPETIEHLKSTLKELAPGYPFEYRFLDDRIDSRYRAEQRMGAILSYATFVAILVSCLGLFGLISYSAEQRTKEIGIRKTLGASTRTVVLLLSREFIILVLLANLISVPVAYVAVSSWLQEFAYRTALDWHIFAAAGLAALLIALTTVSFRAIRAASANPVDALRHE